MNAERSTPQPIRITVAYPDSAGARFDLDYYRDRHMPMVAELLSPAIRGYEIWLGKELLGGDPAAWRVLLHMRFTDREAFEAAFEANGERIVADIPNYTEIEPVVQIDAPDSSWKETN